MRDETDFEPWYRAEHRRVLATIVAVAGNVELGREATDEAFARALERWDRVRHMQAPTGWVYTVALNLLRRGAQRRRLERRSLERAGLIRSARTPLAHADQPPDTLAVEVWDAVRALAPREREALALRYLGGLTEAQVARAMGIASGTVARALHDARQHLAVSLTPPPAPDNVEVEAGHDR